MMSREELQAELAKANHEKALLNAVVEPLRAKRDAIVAQMAPLEADAAKVADEIKVHMPKMAEIDRKLEAIAGMLGHPRVGGTPHLFGG